MARTINQGFETLKSWLEITDRQENLVAIRQQGVRNTITSEIDVIEDFLTGSYRRQTMIAPLSKADADVFCVLSGEIFEPYKDGGQATLLDRVKRILQRNYDTTENINRDGQAVTISFSEFKIDVVPAFQVREGGYWIPNSITGKWIRSDPRKHITLWSEANSKHNDDLKPLIKMIKCWNREVGGGLLSSFHLECLVLQVINSVQISDYPSGVRYFFDKARELIRYAIPDPAGANYNPNVGEYLVKRGKVDDVQSKLQTAYTRAIKAEEAAKMGNIEEAFRNWRLIFGDYFPAYS